MIEFKHRGSFGKMEKFLNGVPRNNRLALLVRYGRAGVTALEAATPVDSGITAGSWDYAITMEKKGYKIAWTNSSANEGIPIAILIQYGHVGMNGTYIEPNDFINPAIKETFNIILQKVWEEVTTL